MTTINVNINGTRHDLTPEQVDDIVSQAFLVINSDDVQQAIAELEEAMLAAGVITVEG